MNAEPLVSVLIISYNQEQFIASTIDSVLTQTYKNIEILIGDDASTDNTAAIIESYQARYPDVIKPVYHHQNVGIPKNINSILSKVSGEYISILGGDDLYVPDKIETQVHFMAQNQDCIGCYAKHEAFDSNTNNILYVSRKPKRELQGGYEFLRLSSAYRVDMLTIFFRREYSEPFNENLVAANDILFVESLNMRGQLGYINRVLYRYRRHNKSIMYSMKHNYEFHLKEATMFYELFSKRFNPPAEYLKMAISREYCYAAASAVLFDNRPGVAADYLKISKSYYKAPFIKSVYYLVYYNAPALMMQHVLAVALALQLNYAIRLLYKVYVIYNPKFKRHDV